MNIKIVDHADSLGLFADAVDRNNTEFNFISDEFVCNGKVVPCTRSLRSTDSGFVLTSLRITIAGEDGLLTNRNGPACIEIEYVPQIGFPLTNALINIIDVPPVSISVQATMENLSED